MAKQATLWGMGNLPTQLDATPAGTGGMTMGKTGVGVLLSRLVGLDDSAAAFSASVGKELAAVELVSDELLLTFVDGTQMAMYDDGQSCCEHRYMTTDDDLAYFVDSILLGVEVADAPSLITDYYDDNVHDVQFLKITTSKGVFTMETHNEHNGYYGGFTMRCKLRAQEG